MKTKAELWAELIAVDREIARTPVCPHQHYRYQMEGCDWCRLNAEADRITRLLDRIDLVQGVAA